MNGDHRSLLELVTLCLSLSGRVVVNNAHCRNCPGDVHVSNEQLCIIHSDADGQFFYVGLILRHCCQWLASEAD